MRKPRKKFEKELTNENNGTFVDLDLVRVLNECFWSECEGKSVGEFIEFKDNVNNGAVTQG